MSEVEGDLEIVKPYQFELVASDSSSESDTEADDDSGDENGLRSRDWQEFACMTIKDNPSWFQKYTMTYSYYCRCQCGNYVIMPTTSRFAVTVYVNSTQGSRIA